MRRRRSFFDDSPFRVPLPGLAWRRNQKDDRVKETLTVSLLMNKFIRMVDDEKESLFDHVVVGINGKEDGLKIQGLPRVIRGGT
jgi:hypothetical protein